jgi:glycosyltransferase involved in cell wall biosynthesis
MRLVNRSPRLRLDRPERFPASICWNSEFMRDGTPVPATIEPLLEDLIYPALPQGEGFAAVERNPAAAPLIAFVGRVTEEKGVELAYRALADLRDRHGIEAELELAGPADAPMRDRLGRLAAELGIARRVRLLGPLGPAELQNLLGRAHALVAPPIWQEPAPMVCVEGALARVPIVASRSGGIPEMVRDGEEALLFDIGDVAGCADCLARTLTERAETKIRVGRAFERAQHLSWGPYIAATDRFLDATMAAFARRSG